MHHPSILIEDERIWMMHNKISKIIFIGLLTGYAGILLFVACFTIRESRINTNAIRLDMAERQVELEDKIERLDHQLSSIQKNLNTTNVAVMTDKVEEICAGKNSAEDKMLAICEWICANISNREYEYEENNVKNDVFSWFATRSGLCNARANICVEMAGYLNLEAHVMNLYDFPNAQSGHSTAEVYYDGKWHFFDPTNGGYFRDKDGEIMSLEEMRAKPKEAMDGMVVFEKTLDDSTDGYNFERMNWYYSEESLGSMRSYAIKGREYETIVYPTVDMKKTTALSIGEIDNNDEDVRVEGMEQDLSQFLAFALAKPSYGGNIQTKWELKNCENKKYYLKYYFYGGETGELRVIGENAEIVSNELLNIENTADESGNGIWEIEFVPSDEACNIWITHDYMEAGVGAFIDKIELGAR